MASYETPPASPPPTAADAPSRTPQQLDREAAELVRFGQPSRAADLLEDAVRQEPDDWLRRVRLVVAHQAVVTLDHERRDPTLVLREDPILGDVTRRIVRAYVAALTQLEYLIRARQIDAELALHLVGKLRPSTLEAAYPRGYDLEKKTSFHVGAGHIAAAEHRKERFLLEVFPLVLSLPTQVEGVKRRMSMHAEWSHLHVQLALRRLDEGERSPPPSAASHPAPPDRLGLPSPPVVRVQTSTARARLAPLALATIHYRGKEPPQGVAFQREPHDYTAYLLQSGKYRYSFAACGDTDVYWCSDAVLLMRNPACIEIWHNDVTARTSDVKSDGRRLWMCSLRDGVKVVAPDGAVAHRIRRSAGLPPHEHALRVQPIGDNRAIVFGSYRSPPKTWGARIELGPDDASPPKVHVFFQAEMAALTDDPVGQLMQNDRLGFHPEWMHLVDGVPGRPPFVLVGRGRTGPLAGWPLMVDLALLKATPLPSTLQPVPSSPLVTWQGRILLPSRGSVTAVDILDPARSTQYQLPHDTGRDIPLALLPWKGDFYVPTTGSRWLRLSPGAWRFTVLEVTGVEAGVLPPTCGLTRHHGIVVHQGRVGLCRLELAEER